MPDFPKYGVRSFIIDYYGAPDSYPIASYRVPVSFVAPFANRIAREVLGLRDWNLTLREPWYILEHHTDPAFRRSPLPSGPTTLTGVRYEPDDELPPRLLSHPEALVRSFQVTLLDFQQELYRGEYSVDDIFLQGAHYLLRSRIRQGDLSADQPTYYYEVLPSTRALYSVPDDYLPEEAYTVQGVFHLPPRDKDEPRIIFRLLPPPPLPELDPATFGSGVVIGKGETQAGQVFIPAPLYTELRRTLPLSARAEQGGYLLGVAYRLPGSPEQEDAPGFRWVVEVTNLLMAEGAIGTPAQLLFTGDSWSGIRRRRDREFPDRQLVGWFHTHIFPAGDSFGLSGLDQDMHGWYLRKPWQIAVLLNLEKDGDRSVRCYQRGPEGQLVETPFTVFEPQAASADESG